MLSCSKDHGCVWYEEWRTSRLNRGTNASTRNVNKMAGGGGNGVSRGARMGAGMMAARGHATGQPANTARMVSAGRIVSSEIKGMVPPGIAR